MLVIRDCLLSITKQSDLLITCVFLHIHKDEGDQHDARANPVQRRSCLGVEHYLPDQAQRDSHAETNSDDDRRREEYSVGPEEVADETGGGV